MKKQLIFIALAALILPAVLRGFWFYRGVPERPEIATPDFASFAAPQAPVNPAGETDEEIEQTSGTVLVDAVHGNQFVMSEIESLTSAIKARGGRIETLTDASMLEYQLKYVSAFISVSPTLSFTAVETQALRSFAERGGRVLIFTDATRNMLFYDFISGNPIAYGDANAANSLLSAFDISVNNDYLYNTQKNEGNFRNVLFDDFGKSELTFGLKEVALYGAHSVESPSGLVLLRGAESTLSSANDAHDPGQGGAALSEDGNVAAFGDFTFLTPPYNTYTDNATLIANLADFALAGGQSKSLANFPFLFKEGRVQVFVAPELTRTAELVSALGGLQASLRYLNVEMEFVDDVPSSGDAIIIGTFEPTEEIEPYAKKFDIVLGDGEFIDTTEFGEIGRYGNGILLFDAGSKGSTLVLLADSPEDIISLIGMAGGGSLFSCLTSDNVAVCSVGYGGEYSSGSGGESAGEGSTEGTPAEGETTPEATPTPGG
ncbi:MAG: hypothetical protein DPW18_18890 [Chloroflexi bacterium]|nr:hypothetical protein [Chloroflexota bacterium]MDL1940744.1 hypothetical protein [Chloroflexi bacterium CFX2]